MHRTYRELLGRNSKSAVDGENGAGRLSTDAGVRHPSVAARLQRSVSRHRPSPCARRGAQLQRKKRWDQTACKPGSVPPAEADAAAIPLDRPLLDGSRDLPGPSKHRRRRRPPVKADLRVPIRSCSRRGLPCRPGHPVRGGLLPHPFTLTLGPAWRPASRAVCFLWRYPWGRPRRALPAAISPWSPDFPPSTQSAKSDRPAV